MIPLYRTVLHLRRHGEWDEAFLPLPDPSPIPRLHLWRRTRETKAKAAHAP